MDPQEPPHTPDEPSMAEMMRELMRRMDKIERRVKESHHPKPSSLKMDLPIFEGRREPEEFIDWLQTVEQIFEYQRVPEGKQVKLVSSRLTGRANLWWKDLKRYRLKEGKSKIITWVKMRRELQRKYLPSYYWQDMLFRHPQQQKKASPLIVTPTREFPTPPVSRLLVPSADSYTNEATEDEEKEEQTLSEELVKEPSLLANEEGSLVPQKEFEPIMKPEIEEKDDEYSPPHIPEYPHVQNDDPPTELPKEEVIPNMPPKEETSWVLSENEAVDMVLPPEPLKTGVQLLLGYNSQPLLEHKYLPTPAIPKVDLAWTKIRSRKVSVGSISKLRFQASDLTSSQGVSATLFVMKTSPPPRENDRVGLA